VAKRKIKEMTPFEIAGYAFFGVMLAFSVFCLMMAFIIGVTRPAYAANPQYRYEINVKAPKETAVITQEVCEQVKLAAGSIKVSLDNGATDKAIRDKISMAAQNNPQDRNGWIAFHMLSGPDVISSMREWPKEELYVWMTNQFPSFTGREYYMTYADAICQQAIGNEIKIIKIDRIPLSKGIRS
jgi:hypothetical protein